jgi:hypothetical protein
MNQKDTKIYLGGKMTDFFWWSSEHENAKMHLWFKQIIYV